MLRGLEYGVAFYLVKPMKYNDLKNKWKYVAKKDKSEDNNQNVGATQGEEPPVEEPPDNLIDIELGSSVHRVNHETRRDPKKRASKRVIIEESGNNSNGAVSLRRLKIVWTSALHNWFLEAMREIGLESRSSLAYLCMSF